MIQVAAELADAAGGEVTLAALAARLGVRPPSLYNHVAGQEELRRELALLGLRDLAARLARAAAGKAADAAIVAAARAYRDFAREHPGLYAATLRAPPTGDLAVRTAAEEILAVLGAVLAAYDLRDDAAIHAIRGLRSLLHGFVALEAVGGFGIPLDLDESFDRALRVFIAGLRQSSKPAGS